MKRNVKKKDWNSLTANVNIKLPYKVETACSCNLCLWTKGVCRSILSQSKVVNIEEFRISTKLGVVNGYIHVVNVMNEIIFVLCSQLKW